MLVRASCRCAQRFLNTSTTMHSSPEASSAVSQPGYVTNNPKLKRDPGQRDITNLDILEERIRERGHIRTINVGGQTQKWAYRSELVGKHGLDDNHKNIWAAYGFIIIFGFGAFVYVKSQVVMHRKEEMEEREKVRRSLNLLSSSDRKKVTIVTE